jgi:hypothetical protein
MASGWIGYSQGNHRPDWRDNEMVVVYVRQT